MCKFLVLLLAALSLPDLSLAELRDPTLPANLPAAQAVDTPNVSTLPILTAIWISANHRHATINGVTVRKGQILADGSRVLQIRPGYVSIGQNGVNKKLYLVPSVKKPVK